MNDRPAVLGNTPLFDRMLPMVRPALPPFEGLLAAQVAEVVATGMLTKGKYLREFESRLAEHLQVKHAIAVSSCTLGLMLAYRGLAIQGEAIVPSFTFMATVHPLVWVGAEPVFVDVDERAWNIDPDRVEAAITSRTTAIIAVHNFGNPASVERLEAIARRHNLKLIFDAAHGFGTQYRGRPVGGFGDAEVFSLSPTKLLVAGEGGVVATNSDTLADYVRIGREYGNTGDYCSDFPGLNARLPEFNAILGLRGIAALEDNATRRNHIAATFRDLLSDVPGITLQYIDPRDRSSYKDLSALVNEEEFGVNRDTLAFSLRAENIDTRKYYDPPVHKHRTYSYLHHLYEGRLPVTDFLAKQSVSLPIWSQMEDSVVQGICTAIRRIAIHSSTVREAVAAVPA